LCYLGVSRIEPSLQNVVFLGFIGFTIAILV